MILVSLACALAGFLCLCLAMSRHQRDVLGRMLPARLSRVLSTCGWLALGATLAVAMEVEGAALGAVYAVGIYTLCAITVSVSVTYLSRR